MGLCVGNLSELEKYAFGFGVLYTLSAYPTIKSLQTCFGNTNSTSRHLGAPISGVHFWTVIGLGTAIGTLMHFSSVDTWQSMLGSSTVLLSHFLCGIGSTRVNSVSSDSTFG